MTGSAVKQILKNEGIILSDVAARLKISSQNLQSILSAADVKSGTLERLASVLGRSILMFFPEVKLEMEINQKRLLDLLAKKNEHIDRLLGIIENKSRAL